jgi:hypothetical protein
MKKTYCFILFLAVACLAFSACTTGDYNANPSSAANNSVNPLQPLDSAQMSSFVTSAGPSTISATINGSPWSSGDSSTGWFLNDTTGTNVLAGYSGNQGIILYLTSVYAVNIYGLGYQNKTTYAVWSANDSSALPVNAYYSYLGNSGEVQILENNNAFIKGTFYFQGINSAGTVVNVTNGYFNIAKL